MTTRFTFAPLLTVAALAIASGSVLAAPIGQRDNVPTSASSGPTLSRAQVRQQTLAAQADGTLWQIGEWNEAAPQQLAASTLTRGEVKSETIAARRSGDLTGAGEEDFAVASRHSTVGASTHAAAQSGAFSRLFAKLRGSNAGSAASGS